jgi:hypothetical protein
MAPRIRKSLQRVHNVGNIVFLSFAVAAALFLAFNIPNMSTRATAENTDVLDVAAESKTYCEKWGMKFGTPEHSICAQDLQRVREAQVDRIAGANPVGVWPW